MARGFKLVRFSVLIGLAAFVICGVAVFCTHRGAHGRTVEERAAYDIGEKAGMEAPAGAKLPTDIELNMMAQKYFEHEGSGGELQNPPPAAAGKLSRQATVFLRLTQPPLQLLV